MALNIVMVVMVAMVVVAASSAGVRSRYARELLPYAPAGYAKPVYPNAIPIYNFDYKVQDDYTGSHFGHAEAREGYKTQGKYFVHLPDGRIQTVTYYADETGYHPTVTYEGVAKYPVHAVKAAVPLKPVGSYGVPSPAYF
ncbi:cuticle protein 7 [Procambarus clarkii]|uniref:cuticle protein 7 n=1 Tax=Procambarus clarkii TaxID=6728 RepID=UPI001E678BC4|nr:cuticle protein 7-like [Procambarus clarkii]